MLKLRFSILSQQFCPRLQVIGIFRKYHSKLVNATDMHLCALYTFNLINELMLIFSIKNVVFLKATLNFTKWNTKNCFYFCLNHHRCLSSINNYSAFCINIKKIQVMVPIKWNIHINHWNIFSYFPNAL